MYPLQYIELTVTILGISLTVTNVILANLSAVFPLLLTKVLDNGYSFPNNPLGPQFFPKGTECLDLIIVNSGPGTARNVKWEISRSDREGTASNIIPFIGHNGQVDVRGFIEMEHMVDKIKTVNFTVKISHSHLFPWFPTSRTFILDGAGNLISFHRGTRI